MAKNDPFMQRHVIGFIRNTAREQLWRVCSGSYGFDDLIQDGYVCYYRVLRHPNYRNITSKTDPTEADHKQFMALFTVAFLNHITNLSNERSKRAEVPAEADWLWDKFAPPEPEISTMVAVLASAPYEIREAIRLLTSDTKGLIGQCLQRRVGGRVRLVKAGPRGWRQFLPRETTNEWLCRVLGKDPQTTDMLEEIRKYACS